MGKVLKHHCEIIPLTEFTYVYHVINHIHMYVKIDKL